RESGRHDNLTHVMNEASDVIGFIDSQPGDVGYFASDDGGGDAMLPEAAPGKWCVAGEGLKIFDDWRDGGELANLAHAQIKNGFFDVVNGRGQAVVNGIHQPEEARGQARVAADDFRNLGGVTAFGVQQFAQGAVDAPE